MSKRNFEQFYFKNNIKKNKFIAMNSMDSDNRTLKNVETEAQFVIESDELSNRIGEIAYGCEVLTNEHYIKANGMKPFTDKTTIVLCENPKNFSRGIEYKYRRGMTFLPNRDFHSFVENHEQRRKTPLFFVLDEELNNISHCLDVVEVFKSDRSLPIVTKYRTMDNDELAKCSRLNRFSKIDTETSTKSNELQETIDGVDVSGLKKTVLNGSMTIVEKVEVKKGLGFKYSLIRHD